MYVASEERWRLRDRLGHAGGLDAGAWELLVQPRQREPVAVTVSASVARDLDGEVTGVRWRLTEPTSASASPTGDPPASATGRVPSLLAELVTVGPRPGPT